MPRFRDEWLIDRTMFDYVQGGSCACCSFNFLPAGTKGLIESMSEFETDAANSEVRALDALPWPSDMKDNVWLERVRIRQFCKKNMNQYREFWEEHGDAYGKWFHNLDESKLRRMFQLPRCDVMERLKGQNYHLHAAFGTVLHAVTEQVANFPVTCYPIDGRGEAEVGFEEILTFDRRAGFTLQNIGSSETRHAWLVRHKALGGPKLLERHAKKVQGNDSSSDEESETEAIEPTPSEPPTPSFRSDRRIIRLLIARHFADVLQRAFLKDTENKNYDIFQGGLV